MRMIKPRIVRLEGQELDVDRRKILRWIDSVFDRSTMLQTGSRELDSQLGH
jgi:hypothetical protein